MKESQTALVLAGSGRSGTTWLSQVIESCKGGTAVFEPLDHSNLQSPPIDTTAPSIPGRYLRATESHPAWKDYWTDIFAGRIENIWTRRDCRFVPNWSKRNRYTERVFYRLARSRYRLAKLKADWLLVKVIRANLLLGWLVENFPVKVAYVTRHPCAVVASRLRLRWSSDLAGIKVQSTLMQDFLEPFEALIAAAHTPVEQMAVLWSVENYVPLKLLPLKNVHCYQYERIMDRPEEILLGMFADLGVQPSWRTKRHLAEAALNNRRDATWHAGLGEAAGRRVLEICNEFGIHMYSTQYQPTLAPEQVFSTPGEMIVATT